MTKRDKFETRQMIDPDSAFAAVLKRSAERQQAREQGETEPAPVWIVIADDGPEAA